MGGLRSQQLERMAYGEEVQRMREVQSRAARGYALGYVLPRISHLYWLQ